MTIKISHSTRGAHRDTEFIATAKIYVNDTDNHTFVINEVPVSIGQLKDGLWWLIPSWDDDELNFEDIGPFDTADQAAVMLRLQSTDHWISS